MFYLFCIKDQLCRISVLPIFGAYQLLCLMLLSRFIFCRVVDLWLLFDFWMQVRCPVPD